MGLDSPAAQSKECRHITIHSFIEFTTGKTSWISHRNRNSKFLLNSRKWETITGV